MCVCVCVYIYIYIYIYTHSYMNIYTRVCVYIYIYIYIYIYAHTHTYMYKHTHSKINGLFSCCFFFYFMNPTYYSVSTFLLTPFFFCHFVDNFVSSHPIFTIISSFSNASATCVYVKMMIKASLIGPEISWLLYDVISYQFGLQSHFFRNGWSSSSRSNNINIKK